MKLRMPVFVGAAAVLFGLSACADMEPPMADGADTSGDAVTSTSADAAGTGADAGTLGSSSVGEPAFESAEYFEARVGDRVFFAYDRADLGADAQQTLFAQAEWLNANPGARIQVEGHCDERGTREYNLALGERRAEAVKAFLVGAGVDESRIGTVSYGKERPVAVCSDESCWSQNRRGVTVVSAVPVS